MQFEDQARKLRELMHRARNTRTIAVTSGKGGVGKSNVAINLSILLSAAGNRVALVDADLGLANLDVLAGVDVRANLSHVIAGDRLLEDVIVDLPGGVQLIPGASGLTKLANLSEFQCARLLQQLAELEADNDIIVVDCGAGIGPNMLHFVTGSDTALIVTTPEPTAIADAYAVIKVLTQQKFDGQMSLLVNFAADRHQGRMTYQRISDVARGFLNVRILDAGYVLADPKISEAVCSRRPVVLAHPRCPASRCLAALATRICSTRKLLNHREGFFKRVANWFA